MIKKLLQVLKIKSSCKKNGSSIQTINVESDIKIGNNCKISKRVVLGRNVEIGNFTYLNASKYWITVESNTKIGNFCSIGPGVNIGAGNHNYSYVTTHPILFDKNYKKVLNLKENTQKVNGLKDKESMTIIKNDVWIGYNAIIKRGITIGNGAVIAAGAIVTKDVPPYAVVAGCPAKVIKYRTSEENIKYMNENEEKMWWSWPKEKIANNMDVLYEFDKYIEYLKKMEEDKHE